MAKEVHSLDSPPSNANLGSWQLIALALEQIDDAISTSALTSASTTVRTPASLGASSPSTCNGALPRQSSCKADARTCSRNTSGKGPSTREVQSIGQPGGGQASLTSQTLLYAIPSPTYVTSQRSGTRHRLRGTPQSRPMKIPRPQVKHSAQTQRHPLLPLLSCSTARMHSFIYGYVFKPIHRGSGLRMRP